MGQILTKNTIMKNFDRIVLYAVLIVSVFGLFFPIVSDRLGGSTDDDWNVGGNLTVSGTITNSTGTSTENGVTTTMKNPISGTVLAQATSTPCVVISPSATSTLTYGTFQITGEGATSSASELLLSMWRLPPQTFATTASGAEQIGTDFEARTTSVPPLVLVASGTPVFSPSENFVIVASAPNMDGGLTGEFNFTGSCFGEFRTL